MSMTRIAVCLACVFFAVACGAESPTGNETADTGGKRSANSSTGEPVVLPGATIDGPSSWSFRQPSSSMRLAEAEVPGPAGPALLTVFFFGPGGGGGVEANLQRWQGQIEADPGVEPTRDRFEIDGFTVSTIGVSGTLQPSRMGGGPSESVSGSRLLGAVIEGPGGPWFFKLTGPEDTVIGAAPAFDAMLRSIRP
jgi:hypothetical protein